jgi:hypothetical protein
MWYKSLTDFSKQSFLPMLAIVVFTGLALAGTAYGKQIIQVFNMEKYLGSGS